MSNAALEKFYGISYESLGRVWGVLRVLDGVAEAQKAVWYYFPFNFLKFLEVTNKVFDNFQ